MRWYFSWGHKFYIYVKRGIAHQWAILEIFTFMLKLSHNEILNLQFPAVLLRGHNILK
jgi:hypothetical protein